MIKDAIEELNDHINVFAESQRAHIDVLEIYNTRKIEILTLIITSVISYLAVWALNYVLVILSLTPVFGTVTWAWLRRANYF